MVVDERAEIAASRAFEMLGARHSRASLYVSALVRGDKESRAWVECLECGVSFELRKAGQRQWKLAERSERRLDHEVCFSIRALETGL